MWVFAFVCVLGGFDLYGGWWLLVVAIVGCRLFLVALIVLGLLVLRVGWDFRVLAHWCGTVSVASGWIGGFCWLDLVVVYLVLSVLFGLTLVLCFVCRAGLCGVFGVSGCWVLVFGFWLFLLLRGVGSGVCGFSGFSGGWVGVTRFLLLSEV